MVENAGEKIVVKIDPDLAELIPGYLENRTQDILQILEALERADFETIRTLGHGMKGSGGGYGFAPITEIGKVIETAAKEGKAGEIREGVESLRSYLEKVEVVYG
ncbi:MAG: Hpt domain-containing protein [Deltaproteobacteria bacterium]|nr:Hpt domain-containing protein [Deltaproteobacteria bacterium]